MASKKTPSPDFETSLRQLEALVSRLEKGELGLEDSLKAFEDGVRLTRLCQQTLAEAQLKVQTLTAQSGLVVQPNQAASENDNDT